MTNTPTNSFFFDWSSNGANVRYCITVYRNSSSFERGCIPSPTTYYTAGQSGTFSQTENSLPDGTLVATYPSEYIDEIGLFPCPAELCHSSTLIDLNQPVLTVYAAGTATYTNNPQVPMHIEYQDAMSQPWFAGGDGAAVYVCARRDRACTNSDVHNYDPNCSHVNTPRLSSPGTPKSNSFDCTFNLSAEADGPVYLCATAADQSIPDPDPNANEALAMFPTHVNQFINPATGMGWTADDANLAENCLRQRDPRPRPAGDRDHGEQHQTGDGRPGDLQRLGQRRALRPRPAPSAGTSGTTPRPNRAPTSPTPTAVPGTYHVQVTGHDGAGNEGSAAVDVVVKNQGGVGGEGTVTGKAAAGSRDRRKARSPADEPGRAQGGRTEETQARQETDADPPLAGRQRPGRLPGRPQQGARRSSPRAPACSRKPAPSASSSRCRRGSRPAPTSCGSPSSPTAPAQGRRSRSRSSSSAHQPSTGIRLAPARLRPSGGRRQRRERPAAGAGLRALTTRRLTASAQRSSRVRQSSC